MKNLVIAAAMTCMVCACGQKPAEPENPFRLNRRIRSFQNSSLRMVRQTSTGFSWPTMNRLS